MTALGRWNTWNDTDEPVPYGDTTTYGLGADWLANCDLVEDWGCGRGWLTTLIPPERYQGVDGSPSRFATVVADLTAYRSDVDGVFIRHVLEHNDNWRAILANALASARRRLFIALFTPLAETTRTIAYAKNPGAPDISFALADLVGPIAEAGFECQVEMLGTATQYGTETVLRCHR